MASPPNGNHTLYLTSHITFQSWTKFNCSMNQVLSGPVHKETGNAAMKNPCKFFIVKSMWSLQEPIDFYTGLASVPLTAAWHTEMELVKHEDQYVRKSPQLLDFWLSGLYKMHWSKTSFLKNKTKLGNLRSIDTYCLPALGSWRGRQNLWVCSPNQIEHVNIT